MNKALTDISGKEVKSMVSSAVMGAGAVRNTSSGTASKSSNTKSKSSDFKPQYLRILLMQAQVHQIVSLE